MACWCCSTAITNVMSARTNEPTNKRLNDHWRLDTDGYLLEAMFLMGPTSKLKVTSSIKSWSSALEPLDQHRVVEVDSG